MQCSRCSCLEPLFTNLIGESRSGSARMFAQLVISAEEKAVDPLLGYPAGYAKLCRNAHKQMQGLITPYTDGPPQRYLPYVGQDDEVAKLKEFDSLFPIVPEEERDSPNSRRHADALWQQLDHLGNAGFDPAIFRVDPYGNVVYWHADPASPLFWEVDHWFPHSRGGKTIASNLRITQWQVNQRKKEKLEFLMPWWDLQLGVSVNQFLSAFGSKSADFRQRCFSYLFLRGENEQINENVDAASHSWPAAFRDKKSQYGLAAAAVVKLQRETDFKGTSYKAMQNAATPGTSSRRRWSAEEEEALRRALQKFGPGNWKEIKEFEPALVNRSTVQIKDKYRLMKGDWNLDKENVITEKQSNAATALQKEMQLKLLGEEEKRAKNAEIAQLEQNLNEVKEYNDRELDALKSLEAVLNDHRKQVEKQRRWAETQSSYRLCLERTIRDTLHQNTVYTEQARLNQAACNVMMARLETMNATCEAAEVDLLTRFQQRKELEALAPALSMYTLKGRDVVDVSSCLSQPDTHEHLSYRDAPSMPLEDGVVMKEHNVVHSSQELHSEEASKTQDSERQRETCGPETAKKQSRGKRSRVTRSTKESMVVEKTKEDEAADPELDVVVVGYEYERCDEVDRIEEPWDGEVKHFSTAVEDGKEDYSGAVKVEGSREEQVRRIGKSNVDKWLGTLLSDDSEIPGGNTNTKGGEPSSISKGSKVAATDDKSKGLLSGLLRRLSFKQQLEATMLRKETVSEVDKKSTGSPELKFKEWEDLALKMGEVTLSSNEQVGHEEEEIANGDDEEFDDAVSKSPVPTEISDIQTQATSLSDNKPKGAGASLMRSLHEEGDAPLARSCSRSRPGYLQEWNAREHAKNGLKQSFKVCSQAWSKAMKKLEERIQDVQ